MQEYPLKKVFQLLEPGPTVLVSTAPASPGGHANLMAMSWHMMLAFVPPLLACVVSSANHSFTALCGTRQCVIAIPDLALAPTVVDIGNCSGAEVDKFAAFGLTALPASLVAAPLVGECFANLECRVADDALVDKYNLFVLEVVKAWCNPDKIAPGRSAQPLAKTIHHRGDGTFAVDGQTLNLRTRMVKWPEFT